MRSPCLTRNTAPAVTTPVLLVALSAAAQAATRAPRADSTCPGLTAEQARAHSRMGAWPADKIDVFKRWTNTGLQP